VGGVKDAWFEAQERGWEAPNTFVCAQCVEDTYLQSLLANAAVHPTCDYCGRTEPEPIAAPAHVLVEAIFTALHAYYCEPGAGGVPYDKGYVVEAVSFEDVLEDLGFEGHSDLFDAVVNSEANGDDFVPAADGYWAGSHAHEVLSSGWNAFAHVVKHETRFHFTHVPEASAGSPFEMDVRNTLPTIAERLRPLIRQLPAGTEVYRARIRNRNQTWVPGAVEMGAPPSAKAGAGRMNPAGIPYLYASFDPVTARRELGVGARTSRTVFSAAFVLGAPLTVVDLTQLPEIPSVFDVDRKAEREQALFIRQFVATISEPVVKDGREHIDYVPSQVICEYLAQVFDVGGGERLGGLLFPSAVHPGGKNLVVFPDDRDVSNFHGVIFVRAGR
jgi:RES domain-containing protein